MTSGDMTEPGASLWADRPWLLGTQYKTDANLAARQSIYAYQHPRHDIAGLVIGLAALTGRETVTDVGCGNGAYLAELARRGHAGPVLGVDLSPGMLHAARDRVTQAGGSLPGLAVADATALPLPAGAADVTMAPHMLYHVPDPAAAVRELRRVTRPGGRVLVVLNGADHLLELRELVATSVPDETAGRSERLTLDGGADLLAGCFDSVTRHDFLAELVVPDPGPVAAYVLSSWAGQHGPDAQRLVTDVLTGLPTDQAGNMRIRTHSGCLVCT
jgi:SAM-dependent methyltransferase